MNAPERFIKILNDIETESEQTPIFMDDDGTTYAYVQYSNLYLLAVSRNNMNATSIVQFLYKLVSVFKYYFTELEEESIRDNFVIIYELLDEMMDFGYPQYSEAAILSEFIKTDAHKLEVSEVKAPMAVTNAVSWRNEGIVYKKNEVFLDVVEAINLLVRIKNESTAFPSMFRLFPLLLPNVMQRQAFICVCDDTLGPRVMR